MRFLSFDQSTQVTGWAVYEDGSLKTYGAIDLHKEHDAEKRLCRMSLAINGLLTMHQPDVVVFEDVSLQNPNVKTVVELARLQGAILMAAYLVEPAPTIRIMMPSEWRKIVGIQTGRGIKRADLKKEAIQLVRELYEVNVSDDIADAILIGRAACLASE